MNLCVQSDNNIYMNSMICLLVPVTVLLRMLYMTKTVSDVKENIKNTVMILDANFIVSLLVSCITSL